MAKFEQSGATPEEELQEEGIVEAEAEGESGGEFDLKKSINNKEFLNFLSNYEDAAELDLSEANRAEIEKRYRAFESKEYISGEMTQLYKEELEPAFGIKLNKTNLEAIDEYLANEALKDPARLNERAGELKNFFELKKDREDLEKEITFLGGEENSEAASKELARMRAEAEKKREIGKWSVGWRGFLNPKNSEIVRGLIATVGLLAPSLKAITGGQEGSIRKEFRSSDKEARLGLFQGIEEKIDNLKKKEEFLKNYPTMKAATEAYFNNLKKEFFENFEPAKAIIEETSSAVAHEMAEFLTKEQASTNPMNVLEGAHRYAEKLQKSRAELPIGDLRSLPIKAFREEIDSRFELVIVDSIAKAVSEFAIKNKPLDEMRKSLKAYLSKESLGSKDRAGVKDFASRVLATEIAKLSEGKGKGYKEKIMLLRVILTDIGANE